MLLNTVKIGLADAPSLLPTGRRWKLVWHDEFDGAAIDRTKWMCRESFWGSDFPAFAHDFEGVEMTGETVRLHLLRKGDDILRTRHDAQLASLTAIRIYHDCTFNFAHKLLYKSLSNHPARGEC